MQFDILVLQESVSLRIWQSTLTDEPQLSVFQEVASQIVLRLLRVLIIKLSTIFTALNITLVIAIKMKKTVSNTLLIVSTKLEN